MAFKYLKKQFVSFPHHLIASSTLIHRLIFITNALFSTFLWVWYVSDGLHQPGILDAFYDIQAYVLNQGKISIIPDHNQYFYYDVSLYKGSYYFYWGLLPSIMHTIISNFFGRLISSYLVASLLFFSFYYFLQIIIVDIINSRSSETIKSQTSNTIIGSILTWMFVFNLPFPYKVYSSSWFFGRFFIYEQQILFGYGLAMPGLCYLIRGWLQNDVRKLFFAACFFALAAWVRGTWFVFSILFCPIIYYHIIKQIKIGNALNQSVYTLPLIIVPTIIISGLMVLNYLRFESIFDFGLKLQNPMLIQYLRVQNGVFSMETHLWNILFKIISYYGFPEMIELFNLHPKISTWCEYTPPYFFHNNKLMLFLAPLFFYGVYLSKKKNPNLFKITLIIILTTLIINASIVCVGTIVIMRYFIECYYLMILMLFTCLIASLPKKASVALIFLLLSIHLPSNIQAFLNTKPELRLVSINRTIKNGIEYCILGNAPALFENVKWHEGKASGDRPGRFKRYNAIGMEPVKNKIVAATDISAVYIKPRESRNKQRGSAVIEIKGLQPIRNNGKIRLIFEKKQIFEGYLEQTKSYNFKIRFNYHIITNTPYRLLILFGGLNDMVLPAKLDPKPSLIFEEILLY